MAIATMPMTDQEMPPANDLGDRTPREENEEIQAQGMDNTPQEDHEETQPQETHNAPLDAMLHECRVEMVPLDDIYAGSDPYDDALNDDLIKALAHSISLIGLQNPICIVANDIPDNTASYRLVSGRKRYAAFLQLERTTIPAHILSYAETDSEQDVRKALATTEENLVRKHYSLIELCELVGQAKEIYERIHPEAQKGKAPKRKHSGTESLLKPLAYLDVAAKQLQKSRVTVWKYITIYNNLMKGHHYEFIELKQCDHPILSRLEDLLALSQSDDIEVLTRLLCGLGFTPGDRKSQPCTLQEAQKRLEEHREKEARAKDTREIDVNNTRSQKNDTTESPGEPTVDQTSTDATTTPPPDEALISTQHSETSAWNTSSSE